MVPISEKIYADEKVWAMEFRRWPMPSPYAEYPFLLFKNAVDPAACREALEGLKECEAVRAALRGKEGVDAQIRDTLLHALTPKLASLYGEAVDARREEIERFFGVALAGASRPQVLEYREGGRYARHADDSSELYDKAGNLAGYRLSAPERKITTLMFLNTAGEDFEGGELLFNHLRDETGGVVTLRPEAGTLLVFPSHPLFAHEVRPVTRGRRFAVAQWHDAMR